MHTVGSRPRGIRRRLSRRAACAALGLLGIPVAAARADPGPAPGASDVAACASIIDAVEVAARLPRRLLRAIGDVESGRYDPARRAILPWPWTINAEGVSHVYGSKDEAIAAVTALQATGVRSIDVGCMQVNLQQHPAAFPSLDQAFDPGANIAYAAAFLSSLFREAGSWPAAAAAYHSRTPDVGAAYMQLVMQRWPLAGRYGAPGTRPTRAEGDGDTIDPLHVYTPEFRARVAADVAFRAARDAAMSGEATEVAQAPGPRIRGGDGRRPAWRPNHHAAYGNGTPVP